MTDIQADIAKLQSFAGTITLLIEELSGIVPPGLAKDPSHANPDIGQRDQNFKDAVDLYARYDTARAQIIGDDQNPPGSFGDFVQQLKILAEVATQIYQNYQDANTEDQYSAAMVDSALNPAPTSPSGGG